MERLGCGEIAADSGGANIECDICHIRSRTLSIYA